MQAPIDKLLPQLKRVRRSGQGRWMASCPTREDKSPSLSIRELPDGRVLIHDFGGSSVDEVLSSIGLTVNDLFPEDTRRQHSSPQRRPFSAADLLQMVAFEASVVFVVASDVVAGRPHDHNRLLESCARLHAALEAARAQA